MKRTPATSAENAVQAMVNAGLGPLRPPCHVRLRESDKPFWDGIIRARAREEWTEVDLVVAAQLARCQADIEREELVLQTEETVVLNERGTLVVNARVSVLEQLARRQMSFMRGLRMSGPLAGDSRSEAGRRKLQRQAESAHAELADEELLAT